jgi:hypothetical protein
MNATKQLLDYSKNHLKNESFLYNNRLLKSNLITLSEYNINHSFILNNCFDKIINR